MREPKPLSARTRSEEIRCAYREFEDYYKEHRSLCPSAPPDPKRPFWIAIKLFREDYSDDMALWEFMSCVYATLGLCPRQEAKPEGLFRTFDPAKYHGKNVKKHFLNAFSVLLRPRLRRSLSPRTDQRRALTVDNFLPNCALGLFRERRLPLRPSWRYGPQRLLEELADREWPPRGLGNLLDCLPEAFSFLDSLEQAIIRCTYWRRKEPSARWIGGVVGKDHKTVCARRKIALIKARRGEGHTTHGQRVLYRPTRRHSVG
jgi:hypothetical protein